MRFTGAIMPNPSVGKGLFGMLSDTGYSQLPVLALRSRKMGIGSAAPPSFADDCTEEQVGLLDLDDEPPTPVTKESNQFHNPDNSVQDANGPFSTNSRNDYDKSVQSTHLGLTILTSSVI